jgi:hypothetical protein
VTRTFTYHDGLASREADGAQLLEQLHALEGPTEGERRRLYSDRLSPEPARQGPARERMQAAARRALSMRPGATPAQVEAAAVALVFWARENAPGLLLAGPGPRFQLFDFWDGKEVRRGDVLTILRRLEGQPGDWARELAACADPDPVAAWAARQAFRDRARVAFPLCAGASVDTAETAHAALLSRMLGVSTPQERALYAVSWPPEDDPPPVPRGPIFRADD